ncbi:MAG: hypothetical protein JWO15_3545 [Sphingomonadales bacterium]|nr:hypothetical protein [Sphingomonadales bacterium]
MPKYIVTIYEQSTYVHEIEAANMEEAEDIAHRLPCEEPEEVCTSDIIVELKPE